MTSQPLRQRSSFRSFEVLSGMEAGKESIKKPSSCFPLISSVIKLIHFHQPTTHPPRRVRTLSLLLRT